MRTPLNIAEARALFHLFLHQELGLPFLKKRRAFDEIPCGKRAICLHRRAVQADAFVGDEAPRLRLRNAESVCGERDDGITRPLHERNRGECGSVGIGHGFKGGAAELDGCLALGVLERLLAMHDARHLTRERPLRFPLAGVPAMQLDERFDLLDGEEGVHAEVLIDLFVRLVEPELVEGEGRRLLRVEPDRIPFGLAELLAGGVRDDRAGEGEGLLLEFPADELDAREDVRPLVGGADLEIYVPLLVEDHVVVSLEERVRELGIGNALVRGLEPPLDEVALHQLIDGEMLTDVAQEIDELHGEEPVGVVDDRYLHADDALHLGADGLLVPCDRLGVGERALPLLFRVADHAGAAADQEHDLMPRLCESLHEEHDDEVPRLHGIRGGVDTEVHRTALGEYRFCGGGRVLNEAAGGEFFREVHCVRVYQLQTLPRMIGTFC
jgi:hypothetical protein